MNCHICDTQSKPGAKFCNYCGTALGNTTISDQSLRPTSSSQAVKPKFKAIIVDTKPCITCSEAINLNALCCRFCSSIQDADEQRMQMAAAPAGCKICLYCGETINKEALRCRSCSSFVKNDSGGQAKSAKLPLAVGAWSGARAGSPSQIIFAVLVAGIFLAYKLIFTHG